MSTALCSSLLDPLSPLGTGWGLWGKTVMCPHHHRHPDSQNWWKLILPRVEEPLKVSLGRQTVCVSHPFRQNHRHLIKMSKQCSLYPRSLVPRLERIIRTGGGEKKTEELTKRVYLHVEHSHTRCSEEQVATFYLLRMFGTLALWLKLYQKPKACSVGLLSLIFFSRHWQDPPVLPTLCFVVL